MISTLERPAEVNSGTRVTINAAGSCKTCGDNSTCQVCHGSGHWASKPDIMCTHCNGSGNCPG